MGDIITFRPKPRAPIIPEDVNEELKFVVSQFAFESVAALYSKTTAENLKLQAVRGLLESYNKFVQGVTGLNTVVCDNFNCSFENLPTGPKFYLDYVVASSYSKTRTGSA